MAEVVIVTGSREWRDRDPICRALEALPAGSVVITGNQASIDRDEKGREIGRYGADWIASQVAKEMHLYVGIPAQWDVFGRSAGPRRNAAMALLFPAVSRVYGFPLGSSPGTADMLKRARQAGKLVHVWRDGEFIPAVIRPGERRR